jgi:hypothetical protein
VVVAPAAGLVAALAVALAQRMRRGDGALAVLALGLVAAAVVAELIHRHDHRADFAIDAYAGLHTAHFVMLGAAVALLAAIVVPALRDRD